MSTKTRLVCFLGCALAVTSACKSSDRDTRPFNGGGGFATGEDTTQDAGRGHDDDDGGKGSVEVSPDVGFCVRVDGAKAGDEDLPLGVRPSAVSQPSDFAVTRQVVRWIGTCAEPKILIKLSGGTCPAGNGHELVITVSKSALEDGELHIGENTLLPEPDEKRLTFRYTRPDGLALSGDAGTGLWGTCTKSSGTIVFPDVPSFALKAKLAGRFVLTLTPCEKEDLSSIDIFGSFNVTVPVSTLCDVDGGT